MPRIGKEIDLTCSPKLVDNPVSHRHTRKTTKMDLLGNESTKDVIVSTLDALPAQSIFMINSFSSLLKNFVEKYESVAFETGGYKWKLSLYPNGNRKESAKDHISLYLVMVDTALLPSGWEVDVIFRFFLFDHIRQKYVTMEGISEGTFKRFHESKTEWGFSHLIPLATFRDPSKGYVVKDICIFGADVFVSKCGSKSDCLAVAKDDSTAKLTWNITDYSTKSNERFLGSHEFMAGGYKWQVYLYQGYKPGWMSLFVYLNAMEPPVQKVYARTVFRVIDQKSGRHVKHEDAGWFDKPGGYSGRDYFIELDVLKNQANGFMVNDSFILEGAVTVG